MLLNSCLNRHIGAGRGVNSWKRDYGPCWMHIRTEHPTVCLCARVRKRRWAWTWIQWCKTIRQTAHKWLGDGRKIRWQKKLNIFQDPEWGQRGPRGLWEAAEGQLGILGDRSRSAMFVLYVVRAYEIKQKNFGWELSLTGMSAMS